MRQIELHEQEFAAILLAVGYATGQAVRDKNEPLKHTFVWAANALNRGNPNWDVYAVPDDVKPEEVIRKFMEAL